MKNLTFITGGVRSGKSLHAEKLASESGRPVYYLASMQIFDDDPEQIARLNLHRQRRPPSWTVIEAPLRPELSIASLPESGGVLIFDCLSLYLSNLMLATACGEMPDFSRPLDENFDFQNKESQCLAEIQKLIDTMAARADLEFLIVSNEVGWGVVPESRLGRTFRDTLGVCNQILAGHARQVYLVCSGIALQLK